MRSSTPAWLLLGLSSLCFVTVGACARVAPEANVMAGGSGGSGGSSRPGIDGGVRRDRGPTNIPMQCGDGVRTSDEACDDGNTVAGDGCSADCRTVEPGFSCTPAGKPCHRVARCGDGVVVPPELCDDGNTTAGDGCSATCKIELGYKCSGSPSVCTHDQVRRRHDRGGGELRRRQHAAVRRLLGRLPERAQLHSAAARASPGAATASSCRRGVRRRQQRRRRRLLGDLQDRARLHVHAAGAGRQDVGAGRLPRLPMHMPADFEPSATGRTMASPGMVQADAGRRRQARLHGQRQQRRITTAATFAAVVPRHARRQPHDQPASSPSGTTARGPTSTAGARTASSGRSRPWRTTAATSGARCWTRHGPADPVHVRTTRSTTNCDDDRCDGLQAAAVQRRGRQLHRRSTRPRCSTGRRSSSRSTATPSRRPSERRSPPSRRPTSRPGAIRRRLGIAASTTSASPARCATGSSTTPPRRTSWTSPATTTSGCSSTEARRRPRRHPHAGAGVGDAQRRRGAQHVRPDGRLGLRGRRVPGRAPDHRLVVQADAERVQRRAQRVPAGLRRRHRGHRRGVRRRGNNAGGYGRAAPAASWARTAATASSSPTTRTATTASTTATRARAGVASS